jgi:hypothetical protein
MDIKKLLNPSDQQFLDETTGVSWVPKNPRELILPYMSDVPEEEKKDVDKRREKAKEVVDGYTKIVEDCKRLEGEIEQRCKHVKVPLSRGKHLPVIEAVARVFGLGEVEEITFEMYKVCIRELAKIANNTGAPK